MTWLLENSCELFFGRVSCSSYQQPAISAGVLIVRSENYIYAIGQRRAANKNE